MWKSTACAIVPSVMKFYSSIKPYLLILSAFTAVLLMAPNFSKFLTGFIEGQSDDGHKLMVLVTIILVFSVGFIVYYLAKSTFIPSFVLVILFGFAAKDLFQPIFYDQFTINVITTLGAVYILFGGGLETPFKNFKKLFRYIFSLAFVGTFITSISLSWIIVVVAKLAGFEISLPAIIVLGTALASTDPAAIIPCFENLVFKKHRVKYIAISESALNDVIGAILTIAFLTLFQNGLDVSSIGEAYGFLLTADTFFLLAKSVVVGIIVGVLGYYILEFWNKFKQRSQAEEETDNAFFLAIPILTFAIGELFGGPGSGFLAAFLSALLFSLSDHIKHVEHYFNSTVKSFMKPMIFIILGSLIDLPKLIEFAPIGIIVAIIFMFVLRPIVVFSTLGPFVGKGEKLSIRELIFLSFVRETGVIPAVLLITLAGSGIASAEVILPIGMWVILLTLLIEPPLTPWLAKRLKVADRIDPEPITQLGGGTQPTAVLVSRGASFARRLPNVVDWAVKHNIFSVAILHSPEEKYSDEYVQEKQEIADALFLKINKDRANKQEKEIRFEYISSQGYLQDNIQRYIDTHENISIIFAGKRMLDIRSKDIKELSVPFLFID